VGRRPARAGRREQCAAAARWHDRQSQRAAALVELFNIFNHANYGGYSTAQTQPGFRFTF